MRVNFSSVTNVDFKAGKVHLFSDFDGTYLPVKQSVIENDIDNQKMVEYAQKMNDFFKSTKNDLDFHITTGRDYGSYKKVSELLKLKKIPLALPKSFITDNGWKEYCINNNSDDFYKNGEFPFDENIFSARPHCGEKSKIFNPKELLETTRKNSDLIIVAGNHNNDKEMLNPLKYLNLEKYEEKSQNKSFFKKDMKGKLLDLKAIYEGENTESIRNLWKEFKASGLLKEIEDLPVYSIIVKNPNKKLTEDLELLLDTFRSTGKIIEVEAGNLKDGIKNSIKKYAKFSSKFKSGMSKNFSKIIGINKNLNKKIIILSGICLATLFTGYFCLFNRNIVKHQTKTEAELT